MLEWNLDLFLFFLFKGMLRFFESIRNPASDYEDNSKVKTSKDSSQTSTAYTEINEEMVRQFNRE